MCCSIYSTSPLIWSSVMLKCKSCKNPVDDPPAFLVIITRTRTCSTIVLLYFISNKWPLSSSPSFSFLHLFILVSHPQDSFPKTHNQLCSCSYHPLSSDLQLNVHTLKVCSYFKMYSVLQIVEYGKCSWILRHGHWMHFVWKRWKNDSQFV